MISHIKHSTISSFLKQIIFRLFPFCRKRVCYRIMGTMEQLVLNVVALTLEDFPAGTTNFDGVTPFSAVGLQFLVIISRHSGSCSNVPVFTPLTPNDGECTEVQIGSMYRAVIEVTLVDVSKR